MLGVYYFIAILSIPITVYAYIVYSAYVFSPLLSALIKKEALASLSVRISLSYSLAIDAVVIVPTIAYFSSVAGGTSVPVTVS